MKTRVLEDYFLNHYDDVIQKKCCKNNCKVNCSNKLDHFIVNGEKISNTGGCDCVIITNTTYNVTLIELKSNRIHATQVQKQLQSTADVLNDISTKIPKPAHTKPVFFLVYRNISKHEIRLFRDLKVNFLEKHPIRLARCGQTLAELHDLIK